MSSFDGIIQQYPFFRVDNFEANMDGFLSHGHSDHTTNVRLCRLLFCTEITRRYIESLNIYKGPVVTMALNQRITVSGVKVTAFDAKHCPGAVMFLFQGPNGTCLYTGDTRYYASQLPELCFPVDHLYLGKRDLSRYNVCPQ